MPSSQLATPQTATEHRPPPPSAPLGAPPAAAPPDSGAFPAEAVAAAIGQLSAVLHDYLSPTQAQLVAGAARYAAQAHEGQRRDSGEPFIMHPLAVASILADMHMDAECIAAGLLHDVQEDCGIDQSTLRERFGGAVAALVDGVSKLDQIEDRTRDEQQAANFQKMMLAMAQDIRVILLKLVDRLHNIRTIDALPRERQRRIARETLNFYAPIAMRLGMDTMRCELEERSFRALYPMRAALIGSAVDKARGSHHELIAEIQGEIERRLREEDIEARVYGREKSIYAIYDKVRRGTSFDDLMDVFGFRVVVDEVRSCYHALGVVHNLYKPVPSSFDDYIAIPKANGYQSLHTVLFSRHQVRVEVQIRTHAMEDMANHGIAAHWLYKVSSGSAGRGAGQRRLRHWVQSLLEMQQQAGDSLEFLEQLRADLYPDEIFVITPKGDIRSLPRGATPLDFAYAVHSNIGDHCAGCKANRHPITRSTPLGNGQTVEILTDPKIRPSPEWLGWVVTPKARARIRQSLRRRQREEAVALGRQLLENHLVGLGTSLAALGSEDKAAQLLREAAGDVQDGGNGGAEPVDFEQQLAEIGFGDLPALTRRAPLGAGIGVGQRQELVESAALFWHPLAPPAAEHPRQRGLGGEVWPLLRARARRPDHRPAERWTGGWWCTPKAATMWPLATPRRRSWCPCNGPMRCAASSAPGSRWRWSAGAARWRRWANRVQELEGDIEGINIQDQEAGSARVLLTVGVRDRVHLASIMRGVHRMAHVSHVHRQANQ